MPTIESIKAKIQGLIDKANGATKRADTQLSPAVDALIAGYGSGGGGGGYIDVTELPTENINEDAAYRLCEEKETPVMLWVTAYSDGTEHSMPLADLIAMTGVESNITINIVETLPETMGYTNPQFNFPCYVLESTGIAYVSGDGTQATVTTLSAELFGGEAIDRGWVDSVDDIVIDTSTNNMNLYTIRPGTQLVPKGVYAYSDGWYELEKTLETTEKPTDPTVYCTTKNGEVVPWLQQLEAEAGVKIPFVDALPLDIDGIYVLNANGFVYYVQDGKAVEFTEILAGTNCGWVDSIDEIDTSKSDCLYALRGSKTDVIYKVGENGTTNEVYIHENDEWQGFVKDVPEGGEKCVNFYDYDGTLLHSYTIAEAQALTELPELPTQPGLVCQGWNYDLATIKEYNCPVDVGATYITDDGKTRIYIKIDNENRMDVPLYCRHYSLINVTIDWGDGSDPEAHTVTNKNVKTHSYTQMGEYVITIDVEEGQGNFELGYDSYSVFGSTSSDKALYNNMIQKIEIGRGINDVGRMKGCYSLKSITIPYGVTNIMDETFSSNPVLKSIVIPKSVTKIGEKAFYYCRSLANVAIPRGVTSIGKYAFYQCIQLKNVTIPDGVASFGVDAFNSCTSLKNVTLLSGITSIGDNMFRDCRSLTSIVIPDGVTSIGKYAFYYCYALESIVIPNGVTSIGNNAFQKCTSLKNFTMPNSLTSIGSYAFDECNLLKNVTIPGSVTSIGDYAFRYCYALESVTISDGCTSIGSATFQYCYALNSIVIPNSVTSIGGNAFYSCTSLKNVAIPDGVTSIGSGAFNSCISLESAVIPSGVVIVDTNVFSSCASLKNVTIPDGVTSIGSGAFSGCFALTSIAIPSSVTSIVNQAFYYCYGMKYYDFTRHESVPTLTSTAVFTGIPSDCEIRVPVALYDEWIAATNWSTYASKIVGV